MNMFKQFSAAVLGCLLAVPAFAEEPKIQYADIPGEQGFRMAYTEYGQGQPLILFHGGGLTSAMYSGQIEALSKNYRLILPDTRGHGASTNPSHAFGYNLLADDAAAFIDALKLDTKPIVGGFSDGGVITMHFGMQYPDKAKALIIAGEGCLTTEKDLNRYNDGMKFFYSKDVPLGPDAVLTDADLDAMYAADPAGWDYTAKLHAKPGEPNYWRTLMKDVWNTWNNPLFSGNPKEELAKITVPTLVLLGDRDQFIPLETALFTYQNLPNGQLAIVPDAHHGFFMMKPDLFNALVLDFLSGIK